MTVKLPPVRSESVEESGLKQSAFLQTDTPIKTHSVRGPLCRLPSPPRPEREGSRPSVFAAISHQRSLLPTRQNSLPCPPPFHTHTQTFMFCPKRGRGFFRSGENTGKPRIRRPLLPALIFRATNAIPPPDCLFLSLEELNHRGFCLSPFSCIPVKQGWAGHRQEVHFGC